MLTVKKAICVLFITGMVNATERSVASSKANPIRKVVNLLQAMQKTVIGEGEKAEKLFEKFMCYCETGGKDLGASIAAADAKGPDLESQIEAASSRKVQLEEDLKSHQTDRAAAKDNMAEAKAIREKENAAYEKELADNKANLAALRKAVAAISGGMEGAFLQTQAANVIRSLVESKQDMSSDDRQEVMSFLSEKNEYAPSSGEILGILKQLGDEMQASQDEMIATEVAAVKAFNSLIAAKKKEVAALSKSIEQKLGRVGELGVKIATLKNDAGDTAAALAADKKFLAGLEKNCASKKGVHEAEKKQRAAEVVALADTIKILNDDDALELFKKTLPSASSNFIQLRETSAARVSRVREVLAGSRARAAPGSRRHLDFILLALRGRKVGFDKIVKLIDNLVATLKKEQVDDSAKKEYCAAQFDQTDDKKKGLERSLSDVETVIEESKEGIATLAEEIKALKAGIVSLDKSVAEATEQRHEESVEYKDLMASNGAAKELILFAKNRLQKFYNPKLYKAPAARELSAGDRIYENEGGEIPEEAPGGIANTGIKAFIQMAATHRAAPAPPPATAAAYTKSSEASGGVMSMMDLLVNDLDKEMSEGKVEEQNAQEEYKEMLGDSADKRRQDSKSLTEKEAALADLQGALEDSTGERKATTKELMGTERYISEVHAECDWLVKYFDVRQTARNDEIDSLEKAKAVLSGADYSLLQRDSPSRARKFLQRV